MGIHDADALQSYFTQEIGRFLTDHGRRPVGWDEILAPGLPKDALIMSWRGTTGAHTAALAGNDAVLTPQPTLYLDRRQSTLATEPTGRLEVSTLQDVYDFPMRDAGLDRQQQAHIIGVQANLWTEHMPTERLVEWMALPRAAAVAELGWSRTHDYRDFLRRLLPQFRRYRAFDLNYADSVFGIAGTITGAGDEMTLALQPAHGDVHFTIDGTQPDVSSPRYSTPLAVKPGESVTLATYVGAEQASRPATFHIDADSGTRHDSHQLAQCTSAVGLLLQGMALDIMNPCWILHNVDLSHGVHITAAVAALPFNFELGAAAAKIRLSIDPPVTELQVHIDDCDAVQVTTMLIARTTAPTVSPRLELATALPPLAGRHDLCFRIDRPRLDPLWALDWTDVRE